MRTERARRAARLSSWLPGLGQLYLRRWWCGVALFAASWLVSDLAWRDCSAPWTVAAVVVWAAAVCDAGKKPHRRRRRQPASACIRLTTGKRRARALPLTDRG
ncbi:MAG: hypothetical protein U0802_01755 [Candidatus Binatia bacterium]